MPVFTQRVIAAVAAFAAFGVLAACVTEPPAKARRRTPVEPGDDYWESDITPTEPPLDPAYVHDSGAFGAASRPGKSGKKDAGKPITDAGVDDSGPIVGGKTYCSGALAVGDLAISELMITSATGSGDEGEWLEIRSRRDCWLKLSGVAIESPRGQAAPNVATIEEDFELAPGGTFVVAASTDPLKNHGIPGKVFAWSASDVLKNDGDTIVVHQGTTVLDSVTYPQFSNLEPGRALSFPSDCNEPDRADWQRWSLTFEEFAPGFKGTPNAPNEDVACF